MTHANLKTARNIQKSKGPFSDRLVYWLIRFFLGIERFVPYRQLIKLGGGEFSRFAVSPIAGYKKRIRENLDIAVPSIEPSEKVRLTRALPENFGRTIVELFSPAGFLRVSRNTPIHGPGKQELIKAREQGRPSILVSGHFGNYDVVRSRMIAEGFDVGGQYRPMKNVFFNDFYVSTISKVGQPLFQRGRRGMAEMVRYLKKGGTLAILIDQHMRKGAQLTFFGRPAQTALSAAQMALKYDAILAPCYAIREPDDLSFRIEIDFPIEISNAKKITQELYDSLEVRVREYGSMVVNPSTLEDG